MSKRRRNYRYNQILLTLLIFFLQKTFSLFHLGKVRFVAPLCAKEIAESFALTQANVIAISAEKRTNVEGVLQRIEEILSRYQEYGVQTLTVVDEEEE